MVVNRRYPLGTGIQGRVGSADPVRSGVGSNRPHVGIFAMRCSFCGTAEYARATAASCRGDSRVTLKAERRLRRQRRRSGFRRESLSLKWFSGAPFLPTGNGGGGAESSGRGVVRCAAADRGQAARPPAPVGCLPVPDGGTRPGSAVYGSIGQSGTRHAMAIAGQGGSSVSALGAEGGVEMFGSRVSDGGLTAAGAHPSAAGSVVARVSAGRWMVWKRPLLRP
jgi:hypothetical protein